MRHWLFLLGGLLVWTAHFFALYGIASIVPGTALARTLTLVATIPALAADVGILLAAALRMRRHPDDLDRWMLGLAAIGAILSFTAIAWQALPAVVE